MKASNATGNPFGRPIHGKESTYVNWKCRCTKCRKAHAIEAARRRDERAARLRGDAA